MVLMSFAEFITTAEELISLIGGLVSLIGAGVGAFFAIKNGIKLAKQKNKEELWAMIMGIADGAMKEAEKLAAEGLLDKGKKKEYVIGIVKASCKSAGINIDAFIDQTMSYIDDCIAWYNGMTNKKVELD